MINCDIGFAENYRSDQKGKMSIFMIVEKHNINFTTQLIQYDIIFHWNINEVPRWCVLKSCRSFDYISNNIFTAPNPYRTPTSPTVVFQMRAFSKIFSLENTIRVP